MESILGILGNISQTMVPFLGVLTLLVFVHEMGHYLVAKWNNVKIEVFSVGFGPEIWGFTDKSGTRWKLSLIPLGGYVRMFGDADASSRPDSSLKKLPREEQQQSLHAKHPLQRIAVSLAGPFANFFLAWVILAGIFIVQGKPFYPPVAGQLIEGSAAQRAGIISGDRILAFNDHPIVSFEDIRTTLAAQEGREIRIRLQRGGEEITLNPIQADEKKIVDKLGRTHKTYMLGIGQEKIEYIKSGWGESLGGAWQEIYQMIKNTLSSVWEMIIGMRGAEGLGGPLRIAHMSGQMAQLGMIALCLYAAMLSVSLGLINLFPIPMLDGGHVLFNLIEWIWGRPLPERVQEYGYWLGFLMVGSLMLFSTWNDLKFWRIIEIVHSFFK